MLSNFHILTVTYNDLDIDELGHFMVDHHDKVELEAKLKSLKSEFEIDELIYLSTCNRVSYICYHSNECNNDVIKEFFLRINPKLDKSLLNHIDRFVKVYQGSEAINHLFEVASSIDSMVIGEREIFRQLREAYNASKEMGLTGDHFRLLEKYAVKAAKDVYAHTKIGEKPLSVVSLAIQKLVQSKVKKDARILMIGAGETNRLVAKFLKKYEYTNAVVFNRNIDNASQIQELINAKAYHLSELNSYKEGFDVIMICTGSTSAIVDSHMYESLRNKEDDPKLIIDLSVPRNVDEEVIASNELHYIDIEQLRKLAEKNLNYRKKEVIEGKKILNKKLKEFEVVFQQRQIEKAMKDIPREVNEVKKRALTQVFSKKMENLDDTSKALVIEMMEYMEKKCISIPMKLAKEIVR